MILRGGEKARVIDLTLALHEPRNELIGRKAAERTVFRRNNDVEAAYRRGDLSLLRKAVEGELCGGGGDAEGCLSVFGGKTVASAGGEPRDIRPSVQRVRICFHLLKVSFFDPLSKQIGRLWPKGQHASRHMLLGALVAVTRIFRIVVLRLLGLRATTQFADHAFRRVRSRSGARIARCNRLGGLASRTADRNDLAAAAAGGNGLG